MISRRQWISHTLGLGTALALNPDILFAAQQAVAVRTIPSSGEQIPVIGLGSSATFAQAANAEEVAKLREVMQTLIGNGGKLFDTAPIYGSAEEVAGRIAQELGINKRLFWATKVNVVGRGGGTADPAAARAQIEQSFKRFAVDRIDLIQVHDMSDLATQLPIVKELKAQGRIKYIGMTTTVAQKYPQLEQAMRTEALDFVGLDYAIDNRDVETTILPLALERKIGVLAYLPFGRTSLFRRVGDRPLPDWAKEFDATSWAQFFLKYVISHPAVTVVTPSTSQAKNMLDNLGGGAGRLPDQAMRKRMTDFIDALPPVASRSG
jgi:aryl-alcohol dehydrogenase-like predicted oxidoreductase